MYEALSACKEHLLQFGGHAMAAGLSLREEELPAFREAFAAYAGAHLSEEDYEPKVSVEFEMMPEELTLDLVEELSLLEPYGMGNPKPYFGCRNVRGREAMAIGRDQTHLRFKLGTDEAPVTSLMWNRAFCEPRIARHRLRTGHQRVERPPQPAVHGRRHEPGRERARLPRQGASA